MQKKDIRNSTYLILNTEFFKNKRPKVRVLSSLVMHMPTLCTVFTHGDEKVFDPKCIYYRKFVFIWSFYTLNSFFASFSASNIHIPCTGLSV